MKETNSRLDQLLKQVKPDQPGADFTNDIMEMIDLGSVALDGEFTKDTSLKIEKAPMHMTDLVMDEIEAKTNKSYSLINLVELKYAMFAMIIGLSISLMLWFKSNTEFNLVLDHTVDNMIFNGFAILVSGTLLWTLDRWIRKRLLNLQH